MEKKEFINILNSLLDASIPLPEIRDFCNLHKHYSEELDTTTSIRILKRVKDELGR